MRNLKLTLAYDGTEYVGWQRQAAGRSIQGALETALAEIEGAPVTVVGAGRTDAGVHALGQVASVRLTRDIEPRVLARALNAKLPADIRVLGADAVGAGFHARYSARFKTYRYCVSNGGVADPFAARYAWHVAAPLHLDAMRAAGARLRGRHDFAAFQSTGSQVRSTVRTLSSLTIGRRPECGPEGTSGGTGGGPAHGRGRGRRLPAAHGARPRRDAGRGGPRAARGPRHHAAPGVEAARSCGPDGAGPRPVSRAGHLRRSLNVSLTHCIIEG